MGTTTAKIRRHHNIVLLTDHNDVAEVINMLQMEGYRIKHCHYHDYEVATLRKMQPDAILIDLNNPSVENISICRVLRDAYLGPILLLTTKVNEIIQVLGLEMGADDFLFKPQPDTLLLAKLRAQLRRTVERRNQSHKLVQLGNLVIDAERRTVKTAGQMVELTTREFDVLWCLASSNRETISRDDIHRLLFNSEYNGFDRSIDIYISRIRQKIGDDAQHPRYLKTIRGSGYLLTDSAG